MKNSSMYPLIGLLCVGFCIVGCSKLEEPSAEERSELTRERLAEVTDFRWWIMLLPEDCANKQLFLKVEEPDGVRYPGGWWSVDWKPGTFVVVYTQGATTSEEILYGYIYYGDKSTSKGKGSIENRILQSSSNVMITGRGHKLEPGRYIAKWSNDEDSSLTTWNKLRDGQSGISFVFRPMPAPSGAVN